MIEVTGLDISQVLDQLLILMLLIAVGFIAAKLGVTGFESNKMLSNLLTNLLLPAMIAVSSMNVEPLVTNREVVQIIIISFAFYLLLGLVACLIPVIMRSKPGDVGTIRFLGMFGNVAFMGFPVISALYGEDAVFLTMLLNIPFQLLCYSLGIKLMRAAPDKAGEQKSSTGRKSIGQRLMNIISAPMVASLISVGIFMLQVPIHPVIHSTFALMGGCTVPLAMIIIGTSLGGLNVKETLGDWRAYVICVIKLLIAPVIIRALFTPFVSNIQILNILTVLAGMPVATNATMIAIQYGGNEALASKSVFISTVFSSVSIPLVIHMLL